VAKHLDCRECYLVGKQATMNSCEFSLRPLKCGSVLKYSLALLGFGVIELQFPSVIATFLGIAHQVAKHSISLVPPGVCCRRGIRHSYSFLTVILDLASLLLLNKK